MIGAYARVPVAVLACVWLGVPSSRVVAEPATVTPLDVDAAFALSQAAVGRLVGDYRLTDRQGIPVELSRLRGEPWVLSLVYTSCSHSCTLVTRYLAEVVSVARSALGEDAFAVVTVGFDTDADTPARMASYARSQGVADANWLFLSGDSKSIEGLASDVGFSYAASPRGFDHLAQTTIVDADGRVFRQIYGDRFTPPALVEPLKRLVYGESSTSSGLERWVDRVRLLCTVYDPAAGRYRFDYSIFIGAAIGAACLGGVAVFLIRAWRRDDVRSRPTRRGGAA